MEELPEKEYMVGFVRLEAALHGTLILTSDQTSAADKRFQEKKQPQNISRKGPEPSTNGRIRFKST